MKKTVFKMNKKMLHRIGSETALENRCFFSTKKKRYKPKVENEKDNNEHGANDKYYSDLNGCLAT